MNEHLIGESDLSLLIFHYAKGNADNKAISVQNKPTTITILRLVTTEIHRHSKITNTSYYIYPIKLFSNKSKSSV